MGTAISGAASPRARRSASSRRPQAITTEFDTIAAMYASIGAHGMNTWLTHMRDHYGV